MAYLVLAVIILLAIGAITAAILARHHWRWFHITAAIITVILGAIFPFYVAGSLKSRAAWNQMHEKLTTRLVRNQQEQAELKIGDAGLGGVGLLELSGQLSKATLDAGRRWRNLIPQGRAGNQITLAKLPEPGVEGIPTDPPPAAGDEEQPVPPLAEVGTVVYGFAEQIDAVSGQAVPSTYLGEYKVVQSTPTSMVIEPVASLNPAQENGLQNAQQWTLYELLPLDSHEVFLAPGSVPSDDNVLGRIDEALVRSTLGDRITPATLQQYLDDGRRSQPDDPPLSRWMKIEFVKPHEEQVDDPKLNAPITSGGYFDGSGRALDIRLKRDSDTGGIVKFEVGDQILLKQEAADPLIEEGKAKLIDRFYLRPLNDYRFILRRIQLEVNELRSRIAELEFEAQVLTKSIDQTNGLIVVQQDRRNKLEQDLAQFRVEREAVTKAVAERTAEVRQTRERITTLHRENLAMEQKLDDYHRSVLRSVDNLSSYRQ